MTDAFGRELKVGDPVVSTIGNGTLYAFTVTGFTQTMVRITSLVDVNYVVLRRPSKLAYYFFTSDHKIIYTTE